ncbi:hypothetical protein K432DRAFT_2512 [Lepidopterella palustris CBS 459.81]|uniref:Uncharacterized protein n=1 Tax=Lepidopterella palustris CBS 459.81 TaxID=1314670 RepID=A0A8E2EKZ7_9PEZI|nr:hypothetical protein K432DRAFT_2512 [Lepidopterella palustris CBS 459.81]
MYDRGIRTAKRKSQKKTGYVVDSSEQQTNQKINGKWGKMQIRRGSEPARTRKAAGFLLKSAKVRIIKRENIQCTSMPPKKRLHCEHGIHRRPSTKVWAPWINIDHTFEYSFEISIAKTSSKSSPRRRSRKIATAEPAVAQTRRTSSQLRSAIPNGSGGERASLQRQAENRFNSMI